VFSPSLTVPPSTYTVSDPVRTVHTSTVFCSVALCSPYCSLTGLSPTWQKASPVTRRTCASAADTISSWLPWESIRLPVSASTATYPLATDITSPWRSCVCPLSSEAMPPRSRLARPLRTVALMAVASPSGAALSNQPRCRPARRTATAAMAAMAANIMIL